jgi:hypothetical protein
MKTADCRDGAGHDLLARYVHSLRSFILYMGINKAIKTRQLSETGHPGRRLV